MSTSTATEIRIRTAVLASIAALLVLLTVPVHAQSPAVSDAERRDLRSEIRATAISASASVEAFSEDELRDLRSAAHRQSIRAARSASGPAFTSAELWDLRAEARSAPDPTWRPAEAFSATELRDLRRLAHQQSVAAEAETLEATR